MEPEEKITETTETTLDKLLEIQERSLAAIEARNQAESKPEEVKEPVVAQESVMDDKWEKVVDNLQKQIESLSARDAAGTTVVQQLPEVKKEMPTGHPKDAAKLEKRIAEEIEESGSHYFKWSVLDELEKDFPPGWRDMFNTNYDPTVHPSQQETVPVENDLVEV